MANEEQTPKAKGTSRRAKGSRAKGPLQRHPYLVLLGTAILLLLVLIFIIRFFIPVLLLSLLLSSIIALACYWKHLDVLKRSIGMASIVLVALMCWFISSENSNVTFVKEGTLRNYPYTRIGEAFEQFMRPRWKVITEDDKQYVEARGRAKYKGEQVDVVLKFRIDKKNKDDPIRDVSLELNESRQSAIDRSNFIAQAFSSFKKP